MDFSTSPARLSVRHLQLLPEGDPRGRRANRAKFYLKSVLAAGLVLGALCLLLRASPPSTPTSGPPRKPDGEITLYESVEVGPKVANMTDVSSNPADTPIAREDEVKEDLEDDEEELTDPLLDVKHMDAHSTRIRWRHFADRCLFVFGPRKGKNFHLSVWKCRDPKKAWFRQRFILPAPGKPGRIKSAIGKVTGQGKEYCMVIPFCTIGTPIEVRPCADTPAGNDTFVVEQYGKGTIRIRNPHCFHLKNYCIDVPDMNRTTGNKAQLWECGKTPTGSYDDLKEGSYEQLLGTDEIFSIGISPANIEVFDNSQLTAPGAERRCNPSNRVDNSWVRCPVARSGSLKLRFGPGSTGKVLDLYGSVWTLLCHEKGCHCKGHTLDGDLVSIPRQASSTTCGVLMLSTHPTDGTCPLDLQNLNKTLTKEDGKVDCLHGRYETADLQKAHHTKHRIKLRFFQVLMIALQPADVAAFESVTVRNTSGTVCETEEASESKEASKNLRAAHEAPQNMQVLNVDCPSQKEGAQLGVQITKAKIHYGAIWTLWCTNDQCHCLPGVFEKEIYSTELGQGEKGCGAMMLSAHSKLGVCPEELRSIAKAVENDYEVDCDKGRVLAESMANDPDTEMYFKLKWVSIKRQEAMITAVTKSVLHLFSAFGGIVVLGTVPAWPAVAKFAQFMVMMASNHVELGLPDDFSDFAHKFAKFDDLVKPLKNIKLPGLKDLGISVSFVASSRWFIQQEQFAARAMHAVLQNFYNSGLISSGTFCFLTTFYDPVRRELKNVSGVLQENNGTDPCTSKYSEEESRMIQADTAAEAEGDHALLLADDGNELAVNIRTRWAKLEDTLATQLAFLKKALTYSKKEFSVTKSLLFILLVLPLLICVYLLVYLVLHLTGHNLSYVPSIHPSFLLFFLADLVLLNTLTAWVNVQFRGRILHCENPFIMLNDFVKTWEGVDLHTPIASVAMAFLSCIRLPIALLALIPPLHVDIYESKLIATISLVLGPCAVFLFWTVHFFNSKLGRHPEANYFMDKKCVYIKASQPVMGFFERQLFYETKEVSEAQTIVAVDADGKALYRNGELLAEEVDKSCLFGAQVEEKDEGKKVTMEQDDSLKQSMSDANVSFEWAFRVKELHDGYRGLPEELTLAFKTDATLKDLGEPHVWLRFARGNQVVSVAFQVRRCPPFPEVPNADSIMEFYAREDPQMAKKMTEDGELAREMAKSMRRGMSKDLLQISWRRRLMQQIKAAVGESVVPSVGRKAEVGNLAWTMWDWDCKDGWTVAAFNLELVRPPAVEDKHYFEYCDAAQKLVKEFMESEKARNLFQEGWTEASQLLAHKWEAWQSSWGEVQAGREVLWENVLDTDTLPVSKVESSATDPFAAACFGLLGLVLIVAALVAPLAVPDFSFLLAVLLALSGLALIAVGVAFGIIQAPEVMLWRSIAEDAAKAMFAADELEAALPQEEKPPMEEEKQKKEIIAEVQRLKALLEGRLDLSREPEPEAAAGSGLEKVEIPALRAAIIKARAAGLGTDEFADAQDLLRRLRREEQAGEAGGAEGGLPAATGGQGPDGQGPEEPQVAETGANVANVVVAMRYADEHLNPIKDVKLIEQEQAGAAGGAEGGLLAATGGQDPDGQGPEVAMKLKSPLFKKVKRGDVVEVWIAGEAETKATWEKVLTDAEGKGATLFPHQVHAWEDPQDRFGRLVVLRKPMEPAKKEAWLEVLRRFPNAFVGRVEVPIKLQEGVSANLQVRVGARDLLRLDDEVPLQVPFGHLQLEERDQWRVFYKSDYQQEKRVSPQLMKIKKGLILLVMTVFTVLVPKRLAFHAHSRDKIGVFSRASESKERFQELGRVADEVSKQTGAGFSLSGLMVLAVTLIFQIIVDVNADGDGGKITQKIREFVQADWDDLKGMLFPERHEEFIVSNISYTKVMRDGGGGHLFKAFSRALKNAVAGDNDEEVALEIAPDSTKAVVFAKVPDGFPKDKEVPVVFMHKLGPLHGEGATGSGHELGIELDFHVKLKFSETKADFLKYKGCVPHEQHGVSRESSKQAGDTGAGLGSPNDLKKAVHQTFSENDKKGTDCIYRFEVTGAYEYYEVGNYDGQEAALEQALSRTGSMEVNAAELTCTHVRVKYMLPRGRSVDASSVQNLLNETADLEEVRTGEQFEVTEGKTAEWHSRHYPSWLTFPWVMGFLPKFLVVVVIGVMSLFNGSTRMQALNAVVISLLLWMLSRLGSIFESSTLELGKAVVIIIPLIVQWWDLVGGDELLESTTASCIMIIGVLWAVFTLCRKYMKDTLEMWKEDTSMLSTFFKWMEDASKFFKDIATFATRCSSCDGAKKVVRDAWYRFSAWLLKTKQRVNIDLHAIGAKTRNKVWQATNVFTSLFIASVLALAVEQSPRLDYLVEEMKIGELTALTITFTVSVALLALSFKIFMVWLPKMWLLGRKPLRKVSKDRLEVDTQKAQRATKAVWHEEEGVAEKDTKLTDAIMKSIVELEQAYHDKAPVFYVTQHMDWGEVRGEVCGTRTEAEAKFEEYENEGFATGLWDHNLTELRYYGCRDGRPEDMKDWVLAVQQADAAKVQGDGYTNRPLQKDAAEVQGDGYTMLAVSEDTESPRKPSKSLLFDPLGVPVAVSAVPIFVDDGGSVLEGALRMPNGNLTLKRLICTESAWRSPRFLVQRTPVQVNMQWFKPIPPANAGAVVPGSGAEPIPEIGFFMDSSKHKTTVLMCTLQIVNFVGLTLGATDKNDGVLSLWRDPDPRLTDADQLASWFVKVRNFFADYGASFESGSGVHAVLESLFWGAKESPFKKQEADKEDADKAMSPNLGAHLEEHKNKYVVLSASREEQLPWVKSNMRELVTWIAPNRPKPPISEADFNTWQRSGLSGIEEEEEEAEGATKKPASDDGDLSTFEGEAGGKNNKGKLCLKIVQANHLRAIKAESGRITCVPTFLKIDGVSSSRQNHLRPHVKCVVMTPEQQEGEKKEAEMDSVSTDPVFPHYHMQMFDDFEPNKTEITFSVGAAESQLATGKITFRLDDLKGGEWFEKDVPLKFVEPAPPLRKCPLGCYSGGGATPPTVAPSLSICAQWTMQDDSSVCDSSSIGGRLSIGPGATIGASGAGRGAAFGGAGLGLGMPGKPGGAGSGAVADPAAAPCASCGASCNTQLRSASMPVASPAPVGDASGTGPAPVGDASGTGPAADDAGWGATSFCGGPLTWQLLYPPAQPQLLHIVLAAEDLRCCSTLPRSKPKPFGSAPMPFAAAPMLGKMGFEPLLREMRAMPLDEAKPPDMRKATAALDTSKKDKLKEVVDKGNVSVDEKKNQIVIRKSIDFQPLEPLNTGPWRVRSRKRATAEFLNSNQAMEVLRDVAAVLEVYSTAEVAIEYFGDYYEQHRLVVGLDELDDYAIRLARNRAAKVKSALEELGISGSRLTAEGKPSEEAKFHVLMKVTSI